MQIGRKLYYDLATGNPIKLRESRSGSCIDTTREQDFATYIELQGRVPSTVGEIQFEYGAYEQDFATCNGYRVDVSGATPTLVFSYPDPNIPPAPPVYQTPLTQQVTELKSQNADIIFALVSNNLM